MKATYENRTMAVLPPAALLDNATPATVEIDRVIGGVVYNQIDITVMLGATDIGVTVLKVQESDVSGTGYTDIPETVFGATGNPALPSGTDDNGLFGIHIDGVGRKRFLKLVLSMGDGVQGGYATAWTTLSRASESPASAAARGFVSEVFA